MLLPTVIFELLNGSFKQELQKLFTRWDSSYHDELSNVNTAAPYWDLIDLIRELMKKSLNIFTFFSAAIVVIALIFRSATSAAIFSFCLGIITYRFAIFNNWLGMKKYGEDKHNDKGENRHGE